MTIHCVRPCFYSWAYNIVIETWLMEMSLAQGFAYKIF